MSGIQLKMENERTMQRKPPIKLLIHDNILMAPKHRLIYVGDSEITLTKTDYDLLYFLLKNRGRVYSSEQLYNHIWKAEANDTTEKVVKSAIWRLRKKIDIDDNDVSLIENLWGVGFKFRI